MVKISEEKCTGCLGCVAICPENAITVSATQEGFYFPDINKSKCVYCGKCDNICAPLPIEKRMSPEKVYSLQATDEDILISATSGGAFELLAREVIKENGVVFGAVYDDNMNVCHMAAYSIDGIKKMNGSKYVQSNPLDAYLQVKQALDDGKKVLFSGTPCQVDALLKIAEKKDNLLTVDLPCYGVPSPAFFSAQVGFYEKKYNAKMTDFRFRDKRKNGFSHTTVIEFINSKGKFEKTIDEFERIPYHNAFAKRNCFQKRCYSCEYTTPERVSDITLGSFWGIEKCTDMYDSSKGVSMVLVNTSKGREYTEKILPFAKTYIHTTDDAINSNHALVEKVKYPEERDKIMYDFINKGYEGVRTHYKMSLKGKIKLLLPKKIICKIQNYRKAKRS